MTTNMTTRMPDSCLYCAGCDKETGFRRQYNQGLIGKNYDSTRIMFILNRSDSRALKTIDDDVGLFKIEPEEPYVRALRLSDTGRALDWLTRYCAMTMDDIYITNIFKCLTKDDAEPQIHDYLACAKILRNQIRKAEPKKIIVYGRKPQAIASRLITPKDNGLYIGESKIFFLPHPRKLHDLKTQQRQDWFTQMRKFLHE